MMEHRDPRVQKIWLQARIPVIYRQPHSQPVIVRLPFATDNYSWLRGSNRHKPKWDAASQYWKTPVAWFDDLIARSLERYGKVYVLQLYKEQQKCAAACWNARGFHCECSCLGANHGSGHPGGRWHEVSDTFAFQWDSYKFACRLIVAPTI
jgi:hypothetical protein